MRIPGRKVTDLEQSLHSENARSHPEQWVSMLIWKAHNLEQNFEHVQKTCAKNMCKKQDGNFFQLSTQYALNNKFYSLITASW